MANRGAVVVTGASTGIGEASAQRLARAGFDVFAGVRSDADFERLAAAPQVSTTGGTLRPLRIDIVESDSIAAAVEEVVKATGGQLAGLVNNAGIAVAAPLEFLPLEHFRSQIEVNLVGLLAVTQALLGPLRSARGRVVNISSIGGRVAVPMLGAYAASKFAVEGLSDTLRRELRPWSIGVSVIEPGAIATPIWGKGGDAADELLARMPPATTQLYGKLIDRIRVGIVESARDGLPPDAVATVVEHALTSSRPRTRYVVGRDAKTRATLARVLPDRVLDRLISRTLHWG
jgi:NAD(P)-dependent dehydrogenase (short-subunit alcohol dehydrogenase family)